MSRDSVKCEVCQKEFVPKKSTKGRFCGYDCYHQSTVGTPPWNKGKKGVMPTPWNKGIVWKEMRGANHPNFGKKMPRESVEKMRATKTGVKQKKEHIDKRRKSHSGAKHWNWQGGKTTEIQSARNSLESINWRRAVYERDNYTCQKCGDNRGGNLQAHHLLPFAKNIEERFDVSNGVTLCKTCHDTFHSIYGTSGFSYKEAKDYLNV